MWLQRELSQWHAAAHAKQELQKSQEQLQALEEQVGSKPSLGALGGGSAWHTGRPTACNKAHAAGSWNPQGEGTGSSSGTALWPLLMWNLSAAEGSEGAEPDLAAQPGTAAGGAGSHQGPGDAKLTAAQ